MMKSPKRHLKVLLLGFLSHADQPIASLPLLTEAEQQQLLIEWNDTRQDFPAFQLVRKTKKDGARYFGPYPSAWAVKEGILLLGASAIEVECLPGDLVDAIRVDISGLVKLDTSLHVRDLVVLRGEVDPDVAGHFHSPSPIERRDRLFTPSLVCAPVRRRSCCHG